MHIISCHRAARDVTEIEGMEVVVVTMAGGGVGLGRTWEQYDGLVDSAGRAVGIIVVSVLGGLGAGGAVGSALWPLVPPAPAPLVLVPLVVRRILRQRLLMLLLLQLLLYAVVMVVMAGLTEDGPES